MNQFRSNLDLSTVTVKMISDARFENAIYCPGLFKLNVI